MDPNQQPQQPAPGYGPQPGPQPQGYPSQPQAYAPPAPAPAPAGYAAPSPYAATPQPQPPHAYDQPSRAPGYDAQPQPTYDIDYLDKIAPPPPPPSFLSGFFGKAVIGLGVVFVLAVSLIVALGNQDKTGPTTQIAVRVDNLGRVSKQFHLRLKSEELITANTNWQSWLTNTDRDAVGLLTQAEVKVSQYDKKMVAAEKAARAELTQKLDDARLTGTLDRTYAREMGHQAELLYNDLQQISRRAPAPAFKRFADPAIKNLEPIKKSFEDFSG